MIEWRRDARRIAEYVAGLDDDGRDRVLTAQAWRTMEAIDRGSGRCLIGHGDDAPSAERWTPAVTKKFMALLMPACSFDSLSATHSLARVVAFAKKRASRGNRISILSPTQEKESVQEVGASR